MDAGKGGHDANREPMLRAMLRHVSRKAAGQDANAQKHFANSDIGIHFGSCLISIIICNCVFHLL